ncbi:IclR family transcriptional regulator [Catenovulum sediminis]|uniref:IclR family transcriptional regulator n=1 Tax=Catenovulum sediminis TaxID=1740262 RepID=A0ABV1REK1_9ALTE|nr:IclR family transcriptional regulator [Catenovulum sediminis]
MEEKTKKYSAPALEKGIDILELLSKDSFPLNTATIADRLGRSSAEIYRMLLVLEQRGFISKDEEHEGYRVTRKLLQLGSEQEPIKDLLEYAIPIMRALADKTTMSCHIAVESNEQIVVISRIEAPSTISYSVRVGYRKPIIETASGRVLYTFQPDSAKERTIKMLQKHHSDAEIKEFVADCKKVLKQGHVMSPSPFVTGVTDLSMPIMDGDRAIATLSVPYIQRKPEEVSINDTLAMLKEAAKNISDAITYGIAKPL